MPWEWVVLDSVIVLVLLLLALPLSLVVRRRWLTRGGGVFELSVNDRAGVSPRGWTLGLARYSDDRLEWYRFFSWRLRPSRTFLRSTLVAVDQRVPHGPEAFSLYAGHVIVECRDGKRPVQLAMGEPSVMALLAWLESQPPGRNSSRVV
jgi:hypothetical protein